MMSIGAKHEDSGLAQGQATLVAGHRLATTITSASRQPAISQCMATHFLEAPWRSGTAQCASRPCRALMGTTALALAC